MSAERQRRILRRTITPYVGQTLIFTGITVFCAVVGYRTSQWKILMAPALIWALFAVLVWIGLKYRVFWDSTSVIQHASGLPEKQIAFDKITEIRIERAPVTEFLAMPRPFRRVAIYGRRHDPSAFIEVSLRHFRLEDIEELLTAIRENRPDLAVPAVPRK